jgi:hypothetical protein
MMPTDIGEPDLPSIVHDLARVARAEVGRDRVDWFVALVDLGAWFSIERLKMGVIPTLGGCGVSGIFWNVITNSRTTKRVRHLQCDRIVSPNKIRSDWSHYSLLLVEVVRGGDADVGVAKEPAGGVDAVFIGD